MNTRIGRAMNSENLGARITENRALDQMIWALEACRGKMVFSGGSGHNSGVFGMVGGSWHKIRGSCKIWGCFSDFWEILEWFGT
jgi:hypothetical protein